MARVIRKRYIVKKDLQFRLFLELVLFMFFVALLVGFTVYLSILKTLLYELSGEKVTLLRHAISYKLIVWFIPAAAAIVIISVFLTHQIAGPIFVFQRAIRQIAEGEEARLIHLRKFDKLNDFAHDLNKVIEQHNSRTKQKTEE